MLQYMLNYKWANFVIMHAMPCYVIQVQKLPARLTAGFYGLVAWGFPWLNQLSYTAFVPDLFLFTRNRVLKHWGQKGSDVPITVTVTDCLFKHELQKSPRPSPVVPRLLRRPVQSSPT
jgi:hypothetical protein